MVSVAVWRARAMPRPLYPGGGHIVKAPASSPTPAPYSTAHRSAEDGLPRAAVRARDPRTASGRADNSRMMMILSDLPEAIRDAAADPPLG